MVNQETRFVVFPVRRLARNFLLSTCAFALSCGFLAACLHTARRPATPVTAETRLGTVRAVGGEQRFVLVETPSALAASAVPEGQLIHCRSPAAADLISTADLRVSRERHESLFVANVVAGEPAIGDIVYLKPSDLDPSPTPIPGPLSVSPIAPSPAFSGPRTP